MVMNPIAISIVYSRRCQRGPNVRDILPERGKFGRAYEFDRNDLSDRYLISIWRTFVFAKGK